VPVAHVVLARGDPAVAIDPREPAGTERAAGVDVPARWELADAKRAPTSTASASGTANTSV